MSNLPPGITDRMIEEQQEDWPCGIDRNDVELLKENWLNDPCWDIEDTMGFEDYYIELKAFRLGVEADYKQLFDKITKQVAKELNCSLELAEHIIRLEQRIEKLENNQDP